LTLIVINTKIAGYNTNLNESSLESNKTNFYYNLKKIEFDRTDLHKCGESKVCLLGCPKRKGN
jgi:hypothetical protein